MKKSHKKIPDVTIISYGEYTRWNRDSKDLPELINLSYEVKAVVDVEFGMIVEIIHGKGWFLQYEIEHPPFPDEQGNITPPFTGEYQVRTNPCRFFLGDTIWEPVNDKLGTWTLRIFISEQIKAEITLLLA